MITRRNMLASGTALGMLAACGQAAEPAPAPEAAPAPPPPDRPKRIAITMDDFHLSFASRLAPAERDMAILAAFEARNVQAAGFVTGQFVDNPVGVGVLARWQDAGHVLGNHTWSHPHLSEIGAKAFKAEITANDAFLSAYPAYARGFRFPFLDEGHTVQERDNIRRFLLKHGYRNAPVTVDSQDWSITSRLEARLKRAPHADVSGYGRFYVEHVTELSEHYHQLAGMLRLPPAPQILLVHHNILNALFLGDVMDALMASGWEIAPAGPALADQFYDRMPAELTRGRSLLDVIASETMTDVPAYPVRGHQFAVPAMEALGL